jgi:CheY-like chemotaxis protein
MENASKGVKPGRVTPAADSQRIPAPLILCVDDAPGTLALQESLLEQAGYRVLAVTEAAEALQLAHTGDVDLVITDHLLANATGTQLAAHIKAIKPSLPILLLSGVAELPDDIRNCDSYMSKGDGPTALLVRIATLLERSSRAAQG